MNFKTVLLVLLPFLFSNQLISEEKKILKGMNIQGAFRSSLHPGRNQEQVIARVANILQDLGVESIRVGGSPSFGSSYFPGHKGYGWSAYWHIPAVVQEHETNPYTDEPWNFNLMALKTAARAGVGVYLSLHPYMTDEEIQFITSEVVSLGLRVDGVARDNEPYSPSRFSAIEESYSLMNSPLFAGAYWPVIYFSEILDGLPDRAERAILSNELAKKYRATEESVEIHAYYPAGASLGPRKFIRDAVDRTANFHQLLPSDLVVGEWSGKNQQTWEDADLNEIIGEYLSVFLHHKIKNYYQTLGSEYDHTGLYNFAADHPNRGYEVFKSMR